MNTNEVKMDMPFAKNARTGAFSSRKLPSRVRLPLLYIAKNCPFMEQFALQLWCA